MSYIEELLKKGFESPYRPENNRQSSYLGMSMIGGCPLAAFKSYYQYERPDARLTWYGFVGHALQHAIVDMISIEGVVIPPSHYWYNIEAEFDHRFRGHPDIIFVDKGGQFAIADVKSLDWYKYYELVNNGSLPYSHQKSVDQVLMYMYHASISMWPGYIIYTPRDIKHGEWTEEQLSLDYGPAPMPFTVVKVDYNSDRMTELNAKAKELLRIIDDGYPPKCECGWCKDET